METTIYLATDRGLTVIAGSDGTVSEVVFKNLPSSRLIVSGTHSLGGTAGITEG
jgi:hypothetical protein